MAVFSHKCAGFKIKINEVDHEPAHCHVTIDRRNTRIDLYTLEVLGAPDQALPPALRKCLRRRQVEMLRAWDSVTIIEPRAGR